MKRYLLPVVIMFVGGLVSRSWGAGDGGPYGSSEFAAGVGNTYHYWGETGGLVLTGAAILDHGRYELSVFRMATTQRLWESGWSSSHVMAEPYWGVSASRRWQLFARRDWRLLFGFGVSYKTEEDALNSTHWNFASQLGIRLQHPSGVKPAVEVWVRHWSNAGTRLPNRGQDFVTVSLVF